MSRFELALDRLAFAEVLKTATTGVRGRSPFKVRLGFADGLLTVAGPGAEGDVDALGAWPGAVLLDGPSAKALAARLPPIDPFVLVIEGDRLKIGGFSLTVEVMDIAPQPVSLVLGAGNHEVLLAVERHGEPRVQASAGAAAIQHARDDARRAVNAALASLGSFGVERWEIEACLQTSLRRQVGTPRV